MLCKLRRYPLFFKLIPKIIILCSLETISWSCFLVPKNPSETPISISAKDQRSVRLLFKQYVQQCDRANGEMELQYLRTDLKRSILCSDNHVFLPPLAGAVIRIQKCFETWTVFNTDIAEPGNSYRGLKHLLKYFVQLLVVKHYYLVHSLWRITILNTAFTCSLTFDQDTISKDVCDHCHYWESKDQPQQSV